ncbi:MAG: hypothetical protein F6K58_09790 [Symploca sp. SIO2E9]|nr:hypothetical protein [Symploca sp. SIO2E9]
MYFQIYLNLNFNDLKIRLLGGREQPAASSLEGVDEKKSGGTSKQKRRRGDAETRRIKIPTKISLTRLEVTKYCWTDNFIALCFTGCREGEL